MIGKPKRAEPCRVCGGWHTGKPCPGSAFRPAQLWTDSDLAAANAREAAAIASYSHRRGGPRT